MAIETAGRPNEGFANEKAPPDQMAKRGLIRLLD